jgi:hypothetical protein
MPLAAQRVELGSVRLFIGSEASQRQRCRRARGAIAQRGVHRSGHALGLSDTLDQVCEARVQSGVSPASLGLTFLHGRRRYR